MKEDPNDVFPIENDDYKIIDNAHRDAKTNEFSSFCQENFVSVDVV